jgi:hypothetical protein
MHQWGVWLGVVPAACAAFSGDLRPMQRGEGTEEADGVVNVVLLSQLIAPRVGFVALRSYTGYE